MFAKNFQRNSKGWVKFPQDARLRKIIFPEEVMRHPAKANLFMLQAIIDYLYKPGQDVEVTPELLAIMEKEIDFCQDL